MTVAAAEYGEPLGEEEVAQLGALIAWAFAADQHRYAQWLSRLGRQDQRVLRRDGAVVAGLVNYPMGQYFGGRRLTAWGVGCVAVAPERRGEGIGHQLMLANLKELYERAVPLAPLYPATQKIYRRLGWEVGGSRIIYRLDLRGITARGDQQLRLRRIAGPEDSAVGQLYRAQARRTDGHLDRCATIWERLKYPPEGVPIIGCVVEQADGRPIGYLLYIQTRDRATAKKHDVIVKDLVFETPDAGRRLLAMLSHHRSVSDSATICAGPRDPLLLLADEAIFEPLERFDWMLRLVDVRRALEQRGWPPEVDIQISVEIVDDILSGNNGCFSLAVGGGDCAVTPVRSADVSVDIRGLAALYTGMLTPSQLRQLGYLRGGSCRHDAALQVMFSGGGAWMPDFF